MAAGCHADDFADFCMPWVCVMQEAKLCGAAKRQDRNQCSACLQTHSAALMKADCHADDFVDFCADATGVAFGVYVYWEGNWTLQPLVR
jgi:hypothetical protein